MTEERGNVSLMERLNPLSKVKKKGKSYGWVMNQFLLESLSF